MDLALTNYLLADSNIKDMLLKETNLNINDLVIDDFKRNLDANKTTKETYVKGVNAFIRWCEKTT